jgi:protein SCO1
MPPPRSRPVALSAAALAGLALALAALLGGCSGGSGRDSTGASTVASSAGGPSATGFDGALLPANLAPHEFALTDQYGRPVSLRDFRGHVAILAFLYSSSKATAPLIAQQIRGALDELEPRPPGTPGGPRPPGTPGAPHPPGRPGGPHPSGTPALAVSVDPAADTPQHIRAFLRRTSLTGRLEYLSGAPARLRSVWRAYRVVPASAGETAYERAAFVLLLDRDGAPRVEFPLEQLTPEGLAHDVRRLESATATAGVPAAG